LAPGASTDGNNLLLPFKLQFLIELSFLHGTGLGFTFSSSFSRETLGPGCTDGNNLILPFKLQVLIELSFCMGQV
jgi:hypothetical protein